MCGIVGVAGVLNANIEKAFKEMLIFDAVRGEDSTGVALINHQRDVSIVKEVGDPFVLLGSNRFIKAFKSANRVLIGHNRWATTGKVTRSNAHPFETARLVGVHNGTLKNKYSIPGHTAFDTDSEALYNYIDEAGIESAIKKADGAWALVWYNKERHTINFLRNEERPLWLAFTEDEKTLLWASEAWMLSVTAVRNGIKLKIKELAVDLHHEFKVPEPGNRFEPAAITEIKAEEKKTITTTSPGVGTKSDGANGKTRAYSANSSVELIGCKIVHEVNTNKHYCEMIQSDGLGTEEYRVYGQEDVLQRFLNGRWVGNIMYTTYFIGKGVSRIDISTMRRKETGTAVVTVIDQVKQEFLKKHPRCDNCNSVMTYEEKWHKVGNICLCEECNRPDIINLAKAL